MHSAGPPLPSISCSKSRIAPSSRRRRRHDDRSGAVAEQHAGRAILVVDDARHHVGADDQRVLVRAARHHLARRRQRVGERRAGRAQVESPRVVRADLVLHQTRGARKHHVRRDGADDDEADVVGREPGALDRLAAPLPCARSDVATPGSTMCRSRMPVRCRIHSSVVSTIFSRSALVSTRGGT